MVKIKKTIIFYLAYLAKLVYVDFKLLTKEKLQGKNYKTFAINGTEALLIWDDENIYISFRGTEPTSLKDWMTDAKIKKVPFIWGMVHGGFLGALDEVWQEIEEELKLLAPNRKIYITGHSLGGALATLASARLTNSNYNITGIITFGSPRVGDREFAKAYNRELKHKTYRYVNNNDVVTRVPPMQLNYSHVGNHLYIDSDGKIHQDSTLVWWEKMWDNLEGRWKSALDGDYIDGLSDHSMEEYLLLIAGNTSKRNKKS